MATYKVLQDIEAEDKLIGPLTLRQFVYAGIAAILLYLSFFFTTHNAGFMTIVFLPPALGLGFLAFPWGRDQPTEIWALAKLRFLLKPRKRIWNQSGVKELVTITAPKQVAVNYTNNLSLDEVRSRLQALASTVDTRGWAIKNAGWSFAQANATVASDRLMAPTALPKTIDDSDIHDSDDMLDEQNNVNANRLKNMVDKSSKDRRSKLMESLKDSAPAPAASPAPANYWFLNQPAQAAKIPANMVTFNTQVVTPGAAGTNDAQVSGATDEASIMATLKEHERPEEDYRGHMHTIKPLSQQTAPGPKAPNVSPIAPSVPAAVAAQPQPVPAAPAAAPAAPSPPAPVQNANAPVTPEGRAVILSLANNKDLNVATIAREAERSNPQNEVVIKLH